MERKQFIDNMLRKIEEIPVSTVIETRISVKKIGRHQKALCPFHDDHEIGSFVITDKKGIWKCFACGEGGNNISFVSKYEEIGYLDAAFQIAREFQVISKEEYEKYYKKETEEKEWKTFNYKKTSVIERNLVTRSPILDEIFRFLVASCTLSEKHQSYLKKERKLTDKEIEEGLFFSFPSEEEGKKIVLQMIKKYGEKALENVPGFFYHRKDESWNMAIYEGIGFGIKNEEGKIVGIQIRQDEKKYNQRYVWFSSSFADGESNKDLLKGTSSGAPMDVVYPEVIKNTSVIITEGRFKAMVLAKKTKSVVISIQGVTTWNGIENVLESLSSSHIVKDRYHNKDKCYKATNILTAFDADMLFNYGVYHQLKWMTNTLLNHDYYVYYLAWNEKYGKGIDDVFHSQNDEHVYRYDKLEFDRFYMLVLNKIKWDLYQGVLEDWFKIPQEILKEWMDKYLPFLHKVEKNKISQQHKQFLKNKETFTKELSLFYKKQETFFAKKNKKKQQKSLSVG